MGTTRLELSRERILARRRAVGFLDERLPPGPESLRQAAWAGLQDSVPRAAVLSLHARVEGIGPDAWADPSLVQLWGPRYSVYVVNAEDRAVFTLGRLSDDPDRRRAAEELAGRLDAYLDGLAMPYGDAARGIGAHPFQLRSAATTGTILIRWDGARQSTVRTLPRPAVEPGEARLELARRYLHILGPATALAFAQWCGILPPEGRATFEALGPSLTPVRTPVGDAWILASDEGAFRDVERLPAPARLLPSGDAYWLLHGADRGLLVPDADQRQRLWTPRVPPGALLVDGEIVGTWRRAGAEVAIEAWRELSSAERAAVEAEAASLPLPGALGARVSWQGR